MNKRKLGLLGVSTPLVPQASILGSMIRSQSSFASLLSPALSNLKTITLPHPLIPKFDPGLGKIGESIRAAFDLNHIRLDLGSSMMAHIGASLKEAFDTSVLTSLNSRLTELFSSWPSYEQLEKVQGDGAVALAERGWFISIEHSGLDVHPRVLRFIAEGRWDKGEAFMEAHFESICAELESQIVSVFPLRTDVLREAFALHREGRHFASTALFLIQSDGIGNELFAVSPVSRGKEQIRKLENWINEHIGEKDITERFWRAILGILKLRTKTEEWNPTSGDLNRHAVLHGLDASYGTRKNSLKALSWLQYVAGFSFLKREFLESLSEGTLADAELQTSSAGESQTSIADKTSRAKSLL